MVQKSELGHFGPRLTPQPARKSEVTSPVENLPQGILWCQRWTLVRRVRAVSWRLPLSACDRIREKRGVIRWSLTTAVKPDARIGEQCNITLDECPRPISELPYQAVQPTRLYSKYALSGANCVAGKDASSQRSHIRVAFHLKTTFV